MPDAAQTSEVLETVQTVQTSGVIATPLSPRDAANWAEMVSTLRVAHMPSDAVSLNVEGRRVVGPLQGFGKMWQKTFWVRLSGVQVTPAEVITTWKEEFPTFWPKGNRFFKPLTGIAPGEVAVLSLKVGGGMRLSTGVLVLYADDESFTLMTPQGHVLAGWITFSAYEEDGATVAQAQLLIRANDPLYEIGLLMGGHRQENQFWIHTLSALAARFGVNGIVQTRQICIDPRLQWRQAGNIWQNAAVRTTIYTLGAPARWVRQLGRRGGNQL
jgi:hypothetical protein